MKTLKRFLVGWAITSAVAIVSVVVLCGIVAELLRLCVVLSAIYAAFITLRDPEAFDW